MAQSIKWVSPGALLLHPQGWGRRCPTSQREGVLALALLTHVLRAPGAGPSGSPPWLASIQLGSAFPTPTSNKGSSSKAGRAPSRQEEGEEQALGAGVRQRAPRSEGDVLCVPGPEEGSQGSDEVNPAFEFD